MRISIPDALALDIRTLAGPARAETFLAAIHLAAERGVTSIVETGCVRTWPNSPDGASTRIWAQYAAHVGGKLVSVDANEHSIAAARQAISGLEAHVELVHADSVEALGLRDQPIGLLYLDSWDWDPTTPQPSQIHQLAELAAAYRNLTADSIILLDDYALPGNGKCGLGVPWLTLRGWRPIAVGYQYLMVRA